MERNMEEYCVSLDDFFSIVKSINKEVVLFGASKLGEKAVKVLRKKDIKVKYFCDNDLRKIGKNLIDIEIVDIDRLKYIRKDVIVLITSMYHRNIYCQLKEFDINNVFFINNYEDNLTGDKSINENIKKGFKNQVIIGDNTIISNVASFDFRQELIDRIYVKLGNYCFIENNFIFERNSGKIRIGDRCYIGGSTNLISIDEISIGNDVIISYGCTIYDHNSHSIDWNDRKNDVLNIIDAFQNGNNFIENKDWRNVKTEKVKICDKVWIGFDVVILKGVTIGEGAVIGARSVVTKDVPPYTVVAGNPATIVKKVVEGE